jgi:hypothetical protein
MNLYIEIENGQIKNHPAFEDNLMQAFGEIPTHWEPFTRIERPVLGVYQLLESNEAVYAKVDGVWTDVWVVRDMTAEEKTALQQTVRDAFNAREQAENWSAWTLDDATCTMQPPIPRPAPVEGKIVFWSGADANWKETPARPEGEYKFDFLAWDWVPVVDSAST